MTTYIPTLWTTDINNTTVVGMFEDKDEAIRALFQKMVEEDYFDFNRFLEDDGGYDTEEIQNEFIELLYDDYKDFENMFEDKSITQLLHDAINESSYKHLGFGEKWGCEMEEHEPAIVMK